MQERVRERIRAVRRARGLTIAETAERAGMAASTLSRLESGARRLALDHLAPLAGALGVGVDDLLAPPERSDPRVRGRPREVDGMTIWPLSRSTAGGLRAFKIHIAADRTSPEARSHEGHEWLYVLSGRLRLVLGDDELVLEPGEAAELSTWTPHWMGAADGPVELLVILGPHGERVHLRARAD